MINMCQAKIGQADNLLAVFFFNEQVRRLDVAMDKMFAVSKLQSLQNLIGPAHRSLDRQRSVLLQALRGIHTSNVIRDKVKPRRTNSDLAQTNDVRVLQLG